MVIKLIFAGLCGDHIIRGISFGPTKALRASLLWCYITCYHNVSAAHAYFKTAHFLNRGKLQGSRQFFY